MIYYDWTIVLLIPVIIFTGMAQAKVSSSYKRYSKVRTQRGITGVQAAQTIMRENGIDVPIEVIEGRLTDHYDPRKKVLRLSSAVADGSSVASVAIAAHEVGHALQHANSYFPIKIRGAIVPIINISSKLAWPLIIIGIIVASSGRYFEGNLLFDIGIIAFAAVFVFHAITLPVELNASRRALAQLEGLGIVYPEEKKGAKKVLSAAAMTYIAALLVALVQVIRLLIIRGRN